MESVPDKLRVFGTGFGRALPSHGRGHWFNPSRAHHFTLYIQRPVAVLSDRIPHRFLFDTDDTVEESLWLRSGSERVAITSRLENKAIPQLPRPSAVSL